jgi:hypothetical protein
MKLPPGQKGEKRLRVSDITGAMGMKRFTGWVLSVGLVFASAAANAQVLAPYSLTSDIDGPYASVGGRYAAGVVPEVPGPAYGPRLLPALEVYTIVRESGFSPLGIPQQRGLFYTIAVIDRGGDDGRLVIDARTGRIVRFMPASRMGDNFNDTLTTTYGPVGPLPPVAALRGPPRPPRPIPRVATRTPPPPHAGEAHPLAAKPAAAPAQQSAAAPAKPAEQQTTGQAAAPTQAAVPAIVEAKPAPQIAPTQDMPKAQGLD